MNRDWRRSREGRTALAEENLKWPVELTQVPSEQWPASCRAMERPPAEVWRSRTFLVQIFPEDHGIERMTVCRAAVGRDGRWEADITWDELQRLKRECGRGDDDAVEVYPADRDVVNVANMRHLWIMPLPIDFIWRATR